MRTSFPTVSVSVFRVTDIYRGCYEGEWGVDPSKLGCHKQAGSLYCFCNKNNCNNQAVPEYGDGH